MLRQPTLTIIPSCHYSDITFQCSAVSSGPMRGIIDGCHVRDLVAGQTELGGIKSSVSRIRRESRGMSSGP